MTGLGDKRLGPSHDEPFHFYPQSAHGTISAFRLDTWLQPTMRILPIFILMSALHASGDPPPSDPAQPDAPTVAPPPPTPANAFNMPQPFGTGLPLEGAVVGAVVGGTMLVITVWFAVRYCCLARRSLSPAAFQMTATQRHEQRQRRRDRMQQRTGEPGSQQQGQGQVFAGVPKAVFMQFPVREYKGQMPSSRALGASTAQGPPAPSTKPSRCRSFYLFSSPRPQSPPLAMVEASPPSLTRMQPDVQLPVGPDQEAATEETADVAGTASETPQCPVCLGNFEVGGTLRKLPCDHEFHQDCIDSWMERNRTCPLCRHVLYRPEGDQQEEA